jgi:four helix bundle protein
MNTHKELKVWQKSFDLVVDFYKASDRFPRSEVYGLTAQARRAAVSIPSNIAEGYTRRHKAEYIQFLTIAFSSGAEFETQLLLMKELGFLNSGNFDRLNSKLTEVMKMLNGLIKSLRKPST